MRFSTKSRYGLRFLLGLALHGSNAPMRLRTIAEREGISKKYLEQIASTLMARGLVRSVRGAKGGFVLTKPPDQIRILDVVRALDGPIHVADCLMSPSICKHSSKCVTRGVWQQVNEAIEDVLSRVTLQDLMEEAEQRQQI